MITDPIETKTMASKSPSHSRRGRLQADLTVPSVSNFFALKNYYEAADKVYKKFQESLQRSAENDKTRGVYLDNAYVYGKRYCTFVTLEIPKHSYYKTPQCSAQRSLHHKQVDQVLTQLEEVVVRKMDEEEEARSQQEAAERARQEQEQCEAPKKIFQRQFSTPMVTATISANVEVSALNKHETGSMILTTKVSLRMSHLSLGLGTNIFVTAEQ
jgi:USP8 dimerisation domain